MPAFYPNQALTIRPAYATVKRRYYRWIEMGVLDQMFEALDQFPRAEPCGACAN
jgi:hypothetical protein